MARKPRKQSESGIYHVVLRGVNRQNIFYDEDDYQRFLEILAQKKIEAQYKIYGYCLMNNHVHLLVHEGKDSISRIMSRIGTSYAWWYNRKYNRIGHVFQGRFGSECVEDDAYLLTVVRYIHHNPVKAKIVKSPEDYPWSSIQAYYSEHPHELVNTDFILEFMHKTRAEAVRIFREFMQMENDDQCLDDEIKTSKTDNEVKAEIEAMMNGEPIERLLEFDKVKRDEILHQIKQSTGVTQRQIARVTGISPNIVFKA
ncbi:MAG TPA: transposase [Syntrophomonadaceae bacterium]|nr:transposase [Syntrophomonadaceae bacterium]HQA06717.1 transposase [Syntrophomonadaceae bacterium]HQE22650.1 transposase [Syntrophomonadaceae bacterium]